VVSVDVTHADLHPLARSHPRLRLLLGDSGSAETVTAIRKLIPGERQQAMLVMLDSDHAAPHVLRELDALIPLMRRGDYLVVEDTIVNGHPVRPDFGPGPLEAIETYIHRHPGVLVHDAAREAKFGCSQAYRGYYRFQG